MDVRPNPPPLLKSSRGGCQTDERIAYCIAKSNDCCESGPGKTGQSGNPVPLATDFYTPTATGKGEGAVITCSASNEVNNGWTAVRGAIRRGVSARSLRGVIYPVCKRVVRMGRFARGSHASILPPQILEYITKIITEYISKY